MFPMQFFCKQIYFRDSTHPFLHFVTGKELTGRGATELWYSQLQDFDFTSKRFDHTTGHFTQLVWRHTLSVGAGIATSKNGWTICVARYAPPGNVLGMFDVGVGDLCAQNQGLAEMERWREQV